MTVRISLAGGGQADLESLVDWLRRERELAGRIEFAPTMMREGELGAPTEALVVAVGSGGAVSVLAASLKAWLSLPRRSDVQIRIQGGDGRVVEINASRVSEQRIDDLVRQSLGSGSSTVG